MWVPGNRAGAAGLAKPGGFTLIELLLVVGIIAVASAGVAFAVRDTAQTQLEREGQRLVALLESARARSRASGLPVYWSASAGGFRFEGLPPARPDTGTEGAVGDVGEQGVVPWLAEGISAPDGATLKLGPEPIIERQEVRLSQENSSIRVATDGLRPFAVSATDADATSGTKP